MSLFKSFSFRFLTFLIVLLFASTIATQSVVLAKGVVDWEGGVIRAVGIGVPPTGKSKPQRRLLAKRAATVDAYRQLAEAINGVRVNSETVVEDFVTKSDIIKTSVSALVRGAKIVKEQWMSDGSYEVTIEISLFGDNGLSKLFAPQITTTEATSSVPQGKITSGYTGLIIDASKLGISPSMSPKIYNATGKEVYGTMKIDPDYVVAHGIVDYAKSVSTAKTLERAGKNPLVISGLKQGTDPAHSNIIVSDADAATILSADASSQFLQRTNVVIVY